ncbi:hypothetical protein LF887_06695 [Chryseobacterium sp. MEBOG06]|uniref:hypothetical protein n=1 Tax=Chryseobacterium sp. MEBOG06 TaxID=2879938 RepID=UPI001F3E25E4|nr:hypothetical protein [Chryseobacterium sp. MEBOG06]UKB85311.1 hypothetical protein LF887_06695 [Chryseobacterium sp. MEBOG06]
MIKETKAETKKYSLANDEFREKVLPQIKHDNDKKKLHSLLKVLDQKQLSFCSFVKREFEMDDSCYTVALKEYPFPEMQNEFIKMHDEIYDVAEKKYLSRIGLTYEDANYLTTVYSFDQNVKYFCGKY